MPGWRREVALGSEEGTRNGEYLCQPLPPPSRVSTTSQAEAEEALESVESEELSLIKSHASVTRKALQSRKELEATEPQTHPPSPASLWRSCLSSVSRSRTWFGMELVRGLRDPTLCSMYGAGPSHQVCHGPKDFGRCIWCFMVLVFI